MNSALFEDVERAMDLYVRLEYFPVGSAAGHMVIDESRIGTRRRPPREIVAPENVEQRDAQRIADIRRAIYAPPTVAPVHNDQGESLLRVIAARDIAPIIRGSTRRSAAPASTDRRMQLWKSTIAIKLGRISKNCGLCMPDGKSRKCKHVPALLTAALLRAQIELTRNIGAHAERELGSRTRRKRLGSGGVRRAEEQRSSCREMSRSLVLRRMTITRSAMYQEAIELFDLACSEDAATRAYCFRENDY